MLNLIFYALAAVLAICLVSLALGLLCMPLYAWVRWRDAMAEVEQQHQN